MIDKAARIAGMSAHIDRGAMRISMGVHSLPVYTPSKESAQAPPWVAWQEADLGR